MKAAVWYGYKDLRVQDMPEPKVSQGYVKIKVAWAGICGTDRHEYTGPVFIPVEKPHRLTGRTAPLILGHEFSGVIEEVGEGVTGWNKGDKVTASGSLVCGECKWCKSGRKNICEKLGFTGVGEDGCFAEYIVIPEHQLFKVPENVSLEEAVLAEPLSCGIHATKLLGDITGSNVVIIGPGMIGLSCAIAAKLAGAEKILMIGLGNSKKEIVEKIGATYIDSKENDPIEAVKEWSNGQMADVVYECVGIEPTLNTALNVSSIGSKIMIMGVFEKQPKFNINLFQEGERILLGSQANAYEIKDVLDYMSKGLIPTKDLVTKKITLENIVDEGLEELLVNGDKHTKIVVKISE